MERLIPLAPLHNPPNLAGIRAVMKHLPDVPQIGIFDTAFHQTMPAEAYTYAVPWTWVEELGVRRYGFHGTSHLYVARRVAQLLGRPIDQLRIITCHIGNGCSITAVKDGKSIDTSMGLTPLEGVVMGTRSGSIDPGLIPYVAQATQTRFEDVFDSLNKKSGMLGLTGRNDLRDVEAGAAKGDPRCVDALKVYGYSIRKYIGAYTAAMGGVDVIVFTAGVGENSALIRSFALEDLGFFGVFVNENKNREMKGGKQGLICYDHSPVKIAVLKTNEELMIVEDTVAILNGLSPSDQSFKYSFENEAAEWSAHAPTGLHFGNQLAHAYHEYEIPIAVSNRHVHLSRKDIDVLFGEGYDLTRIRPLVQPGQFASAETVTVIGPKGTIEKVRVLGPERKVTQVEVSQTDAIRLGVEAPVRDSGDLRGSAEITLVGPKGQVTLKEGVILSVRHIHMHTEDAKHFGVKDKDRVRVRTQGERPVVFENVVVRVSDQFALEMHIDTDEANAALSKNGDHVIMCVD
jgi:acetate kinase